MSENDKGQREPLAKVDHLFTWAKENLFKTIDDIFSLGIGNRSRVVLAARATQFRKYLSHLSLGQKITDKIACGLLYENSKYIWYENSEESPILPIILSILRRYTCLWRSTQKKFEALKEEVERLPAENPNDESAFYLVALEIDKDLDLPRLARGASPLKQRDAFLALAGKAKIVWISPPLHLNSFANKDFYPV